MTTRMITHDEYQGLLQQGYLETSTVDGRFESNLGRYISLQKSLPINERIGAVIGKIFPPFSKCFFCHTCYNADLDSVSTREVFFDGRLSRPIFLADQEKTKKGIIQDFNQLALKSLSDQKYKNFALTYPDLKHISNNQKHSYFHFKGKVSGFTYLLYLPFNNIEKIQCQILSVTDTDLSPTEEAIKSYAENLFAKLESDYQKEVDEKAPLLEAS